jgi:hypothetical protein
MKQQEKAIKDIIKKYGETINLKKSPYLIAEIIRNYGSIFDPGIVAQSGPTPGSHGTPPPPPPPPPGPTSNPFQQMFIDIRNEISLLSKEVKALNTKISNLKQ